MSYIRPERVRAPKKSLTNVEVIYNTGPRRHSWSVAKLLWNGRQSVGIRWNGTKKEKRGTGNPQSHARATWFIVPNELETVISKEAFRLALGKKLAAAYREKAREEAKQSGTKKRITKK